MDLTRFPFDQQQFIAVFEVLEADSAELVMKVEPATTGIWQDEYHQVHVPQWQAPSLFANVMANQFRFMDGYVGESAAFRVGVDIKRYMDCSILTMVYMYSP